ncbi:MAG: Maf family protein [Candidatus Omnitrophota bacterium]
MTKNVRLPVYLASSSPRRRKMLRDFGVDHKLLKPDYEEADVPGMTDPRRLVLRHAQGKALSCAPMITDGILLAADTVVWCAGMICGKPAGWRQARAMLGRLQDRWHQVYTGVCLLKIQQGRIAKKSLFTVRTSVRIKPMTAGDILRYFKRIYPLDKAGSYAIQSSRTTIVESIRGSYENAVGLPMDRCLRVLKRWAA